MASWKLSGSNLNFSSFKIENPKVSYYICFLLSCFNQFSSITNPFRILSANQEYLQESTSFRIKKSEWEIIKMSLSAKKKGGVSMFYNNSHSKDHFNVFFSPKPNKYESPSR